MEFFTEKKIVRLISHLGKYLIADDDRITVRQSSSVAVRNTRWTVEFVESNPKVIRLKSCHDRYLTAAGEAFLLGMTGNKVIQGLPENSQATFWEPVRDGFQVKLKSYIGSYLSGNGGTPPWRGCVTHDRPFMSGTLDWVIWDVEGVDLPEDEATAEYWSLVSSFSSVSDEIARVDLGFRSTLLTGAAFFGGGSPSPRLLTMKKSDLRTLARVAGMDSFKKAKCVRLKSAHGKYLTADDDQETVTQNRNGSSKAAKWTVEFVENSDSIIRLKSCYGKYLTASNQPFLLGVTGLKVLQTLPNRLDSSVEWEPIRDHGSVKLKTRYGQYLRGNGGPPPWRNSVTHDIPHRTITQDWILWEVHVVEIAVQADSPAAKPPPPLTIAKDDESLEASVTTSPNASFSSNSATFSRAESSDSFIGSPARALEGRQVYFSVVDENGEVEEGYDEMCISFKGNEVSELTRCLETELGVHGITVCTRSPLNGELHPLHLHLPPNNRTIHVVVLPPQ